jgi:hypothetical protein
MTKASLATVLVLCLAAKFSWADTVTVEKSGGDYDTIQAAIDACEDGWVVDVNDGIWDGQGNRDLDFDGKAITIHSVNGPESCIIDCGGYAIDPHRGFYFHGGEDANSIIDGFTIRNGYANDRFGVPHGGAIFCEPNSIDGRPSSPTIRNCIITNNEATEGSRDTYGGAIYCLSSSPVIIDCTIRLNAASFGGGICCDSDIFSEAPISNPTIINCTISDNLADCDFPIDPYNGYGGGIYLGNSSSTTITDCRIIGNSAFAGGGIYCESSDMPWMPIPELIITNCTISNNSATYADPDPFDWGYASGGGLALSRSCGGVISGCTISGNWAVHYGGGIDLYVMCSPTIVNCVFSGNSADSDNPGVYSAGGAISCYASSPTILNCTISSNWAYSAGGAVFCDGGGDYSYSQPDIKNCIFENNYAFEIDGGSAISEYGDDSDPNLTYCLFHNNTPNGDYYDWDEADIFTGAYSINHIPDGFTNRNKDGDPLFVMDDPNGPQDPNTPCAITGTWTAGPTLVDLNRTELTDSAASFVAGGLVGRHINPSDPNQKRQVFITANTTTTIEVVGDVRGYVAKGHGYKIIDYHLQHGSACVDVGTNTGCPATDIEGNPRPINIPDAGANVTGNINNDGKVDVVDIIAMAYNWLRYDCEEPDRCGGTDIAPYGGDGAVNFSDFVALAYDWLIHIKTTCDIGAYELQLE